MFTTAKREKLAVAELKAEKKITLARARRAKGVAAEAKAIKDLQEVRLLQGLDEKTGEYAHLDPQSAANMVRACHESLLAAESLAIARVREAETKLSLLRDEAEIAKARTREAQAQVGVVLLELDSRKINVQSPPNLTPEYLEPRISDISNISLEEVEPYESFYYNEEIDTDLEDGEVDEDREDVKEHASSTHELISP